MLRKTPPPAPQRHVFSLVTRAGRASGSALPASTIHLEQALDPAKEVVEVDWVVEEASARRQRVESSKLVTAFPTPPQLGQIGGPPQRPN